MKDIELYNDSFQNYKVYGLPKAQQPRMVYRRRQQKRRERIGRQTILLKRLIEIFTDKGDVVIDPCAGSGTTLYAAASLGRKAYGFEVNKQFYNDANEKVLKRIQVSLFQ